eukprot:IDg13468t1
MPFVPASALLFPTRARNACTARTRRRPRSARRPACSARATTPHASGAPPPGTSAVGTPPDADYGSWSADFLELCRAQLDLLASSVADVAQAALFFRRENARSGALEFVPVAVAGGLPGGERVWIAGASFRELVLSG